MLKLEISQQGKIAPEVHYIGAISRRANNGVSRYPSYQKIFQLAENVQNIYRTLSKLD